MNKTELITKVTRTFNRFGLQVKKHSPAILVTVGVAGTVASAVMACKATLKAGDILDETNKKLDKIQTVVDMNRDDYTEEDHKKDLAITYTKTAVKFVKLYGPSVALGAASIACIVGSHRILSKRNAALAAAYATIDRGFKEYRGRVVERFGKELDQELRYNIKSQEVEEVVTNEKGEEEVVKKTVDVADPNLYSTYARIYDDGCAGWTKDAESNLYFLKCQQNWANDKLKAKGHLFLNEVYDMLGMQRTKAGNVVGWFYDEKNPIGDNFVDFGIYDINSPKARDFVNGYERNIILDFNVDGNILDLI